jgi:hypothetical protein
MRVRLQLYTVPGQVFYNTTRKLVLKGVDGIVFVADSQEPMLDANMESLSNLKHNLLELNQPLEKTPFLFQYNKRDLRNIHSVETLNRHLNREGYEVFEGAALHGIGVFETLKAISRKTLAMVHRKISGEEEPPPSVRRKIAALPARALVPPRRGEPPGAKLAKAVETSDALFAALEDDLDPQAVSIAEPVIEAELAPAEVTALVPVPDADTAEVKVEFALNPAVSGASPAASGNLQRVETKSRIDIERELEKLRRMAFGERTPRKGEARASVTVKGKGSLHLPPATLAKASGILVDLRLVSGSSAQPVPGVVRIELPPGEKGLRTRLELEIEIEPEGESSGSR